MVYLSGFRWAHQARAPPPIFTCKNYSESYIYHYDNMYSSYLDLKCLLCVYGTVKIQFGNTSTHEFSSYLPSARSLCSITRLGLPIEKFGIRPCICLVFLNFLCLV